MHASLKIRTFMLLVAALFTALALSLPAPAVACWINFVQECTYPNGAQCTVYCPDRRSCTYDPCEGTPTCYYTGEESCCL
ncbi:MAG TPA: hypothetical protein VGG03_28040 [Thermoanaerobaculia bacterium]